MALNINGVALDFDFTSPDDLMRYQAALDNMQELDATETIIDDTLSDAACFTAYVTVVKEMIQKFSDFLDEAFGSGTAAKLIGERPSLEKIVEIQEAISAAADAQSKVLEMRYAQYTPTRSTGQNR